MHWRAEPDVVFHVRTVVGGSIEALREFPNPPEYSLSLFDHVCEHGVCSYESESASADASL